MAKIRATAAQCEALYNARELGAYQRKTTKKSIFMAIRKDHGLQGAAKLGIRSIIDITNPDRYGVLYDKRSGRDLDNGIPDPVKKPVEAPVAKTVPTPQVKAKAPPTPVKTPAKAPAKVAPKVAATVPGSSPVKTAKCQLEVRTTHNGVRVRLGYASSEKAKQAMIAAYKAAN